MLIFIWLVFMSPLICEFGQMSASPVASAVFAILLLLFDRFLVFMLLVNK